MPDTSPHAKLSATATGPDKYRLVFHEWGVEVYGTVPYNILMRWLSPVEDAFMSTKIQDLLGKIGDHPPMVFVFDRQSEESWASWLESRIETPRF